MQSQISEISSVLVEVSVEVPWDRVEKALEGSYNQLSRTAKVKGFRPGKVPRTVLKQIYGTRVAQEVVQNLVQSGLGHAVETHQLAVVSVPPLETQPVLVQGSSLAFKAKVEIRPKIENVNITGLQLTRSASNVADAEVEQAIERLRQSNAELAAPDPMRPAQETDVLVCDYAVSIDGTSHPELTATARAIDLGGGALRPELKAALLGKQPGDKVVAEVTFPADQGGEFAGKPGIFDVEIKELKEKLVPALDDEFAKDLSYGSLDELRAKTRERLEQGERQRVEGELREQLIDQLLEQNPIELPPSLVQQQQQALIHEYMRMARGGMQIPEQLLEHTQAESERRVRATLLMSAVAQAQALQINDSDLDKRFEEIAKRTGKHIAKVRAETHGESRQMLESQILEEKLLEYLLGQATITDATT